MIILREKVENLSEREAKNLLSITLIRIEALKKSGNCPESIYKLCEELLK